MDASVLLAAGDMSFEAAIGLGAVVVFFVGVIIAWVAGRICGVNDGEAERQELATQVTSAIVVLEDVAAELDELAVSSRWGLPAVPPLPKSARMSQRTAPIVSRHLTAVTIQDRDFVQTIRNRCGELANALNDEADRLEQWDCSAPHAGGSVKSESPI